MNSLKLVTIKNQMMKLLLTAVLPMFLFSVCVVGFLAIQQQRAIDTSLTSAINSLSVAIQGKLESIESNLRLLVAIEDFEHSKMRDLHRRLKRFVNSQENLSSISIATLDGTQILSTIKPFGSEYPTWNGQAFFEEILKTKKSVVSGFRIGSITKQNNFSVAIPVIVKGSMKYILIATANTKYIAEILNRQKLPADWTASVVDKNHIIMARNIFHEKFSGQKASDIFIKLARSGNKFFDTVNKEGNKQYGTYTSLPDGWGIFLGMPIEHGHSAAKKTLSLIIIVGLILLVGGILLSLLISQRISVPIIELAQNAQRIGKGERPHEVLTNVHEVNEVAVSLHNASIQRDLADEKAQKAIELRDNFLSVASHELKTPLTTINLQSHRMALLAKNPASMDPEKLIASANSMQVQVRRLTRLIDDLLDIARITAGKLDINKEKIDLAKLSKEVVGHFEGLSNNVHISLKHEGEIEGLFDRNRMEQILTNLISNAIKYGDGKPVEVSLSTSEGKAHLQVKDNGIGIDKIHHGKIFERFERLVSDRDISGLGLGLWIVHRIVTQLDGEINVESDGPGTGAVFNVSIPIE